MRPRGSPLRLAGASALAAVLAVAGCAPQIGSVTRPPGCNPIPLRTESELLLVDVELVGGTASVIVDTGSALSLTLPPEVLSGVRASFDGRTRTFRDARGNLLTARGAILPEVRLGAAVFRDVRAWESVHAHDWAPPVAAGHIGRGLLAELRMTVDVPNATLSLDGPACPLRAGTVVPMEAGANGWTTRAQVAGREAELAWDTAATSSVLKEDGPADRAPIVATPVAGVVARFVPMPLEGLPVDGLVGAEVFRQRAVTFDAAGHRLVVGPPPPRGDLSPAPARP